MAEAIQGKRSKKLSQWRFLPLLTLLTILTLSACTGLKTRTLADIDGPITGLNYQSVLPIGMVILLTILTLKDALLLFLVLWLSHRREVIRLKKNGNGVKL